MQLLIMYHVSSFLHLVPNALTEPTVLPDRLMRALVHQQPDWTSPTWRAAILPKVAQSPLKKTYRYEENRSESVICFADESLQHRTMDTCLSVLRFVNTLSAAYIYARARPPLPRGRRIYTLENRLPSPTHRS